MGHPALAGGGAVITGAAGGLGEGLAHIAGEHGMRVLMADVAADRLDAAVEKLRAKGVDATGLVTDVSDPAAIDRLAAAAQERFGATRLLINNAGIETLGLTWELSSAAWARAININVLGVINGARAFAPQMLAADTQGFIVNVASIAAVSMIGVQAPYIVSKHAVLSFSECLKLEMDAQTTPIQVSAVLPGPIATPIFNVAPGAESPLAARHRAVMHDAINSQGMSPIDAARTVFDQVLAGQFWVTTHPEMLAAAANERGDYLKALATPTLSPEGRALMAQ